MYELALQSPVRIVHRSEGGAWGEGILHDHDLVVGLRVRYDYEAGETSPVPFGRIQDLLVSELDSYRTRVLNRIPDFEGTHVLFEDLARVIYERLLADGWPDQIRLVQVEVLDERSGVRITYRPEATA